MFPRPILPGIAQRLSPASLPSVGWTHAGEEACLAGGLQIRKAAAGNSSRNGGGLKDPRTERPRALHAGYPLRAPGSLSRGPLRVPVKEDTGPQKGCTRLYGEYSELSCSARDVFEGSRIWALAFFKGIWIMGSGPWAPVLKVVDNGVIMGV